MIGFAYAQPKIPDGLLHTMYEIQSGAEFRQDNGGQYVPGKETRIPFKGIVMPVNDKDLGCGGYLYALHRKNLHKWSQPAERGKGDGRRRNHVYHYPGAGS